MAVYRVDHSCRVQLEVLLLSLRLWPGEEDYENNSKKNQAVDRGNSDKRVRRLKMQMIENL